jgi:hypothetical protein
MPKAEHPRTGRGHEQEPSEYLRVARFNAESLAGAAYVGAQEAIYGFFEETELSAYRFQLNQAWHVAVYGLPPADELRQQVEGILATGEAATLPDRIVRILRDRREEATQTAPWLERHYQPGRRWGT